MPKTPTKSPSRRPAKVPLDRVPVRVTVNRRRYDRVVPARQLLVDFLRDELRLTGTHVGCDSGHCGACTVMLDGHAIKSCSMFAAQVDGSEIVTIEGIAPDGQLDRVQAAFRRNHGLQCGFCTPGMVLAAHELLKENPHPTEEDVRVAISGNLCRCTGYQNIVKSILDAAGGRRS